MFVNRSDVICFRSIQRDKRVTGANAMSASFAGNGTVSPLLRTNVIARRARARAVNTGFQRVAGATSGSSAIFRGPILRSRSGAIDRRQLAAAISRSPAVIVTCASFSASANVEADTAGPEAGDVPKVGGAPGVAGGVGTRRPAAGRGRRRPPKTPERRGDQELSSGVHAHPPPPGSERGQRTL